MLYELELLLNRGSISVTFQGIWVASQRAFRGFGATQDLGQICGLSPKKIGLAFQIFNAVNNAITTLQTSEIFDRFAQMLSLLRLWKTVKLQCVRRKPERCLAPRIFMIRRSVSSISV